MIHVLDASKSVVVVSSLLDPSKKEEYAEDIVDLYSELRDEFYAGLDERNYVTCVSLFFSSLGACVRPRLCCCCCGLFLSLLGRFGGGECCY